MNKVKPQNQCNAKTLQNVISENENFYGFKINGTKVKVYFSQNANSPTIENVLVNIAIRKTD